jgi:hypothetical protein
MSILPERNGGQIPREKTSYKAMSLSRRKAEACIQEQNIFALADW